MKIDKIINNIYSKYTILLLIVITIFIGFNLYFSYSQQNITYNDGKGWDGRFYYEVSEQIYNDTQINSVPPFVFRIGLPYLVTLFFQNDIMTGFKFFNIIFNLCFILIFAFWIYKHSGSLLSSSLLAFLAIIQWTFPLRMTYYEIINIDSLVLLMLMVGIIFFDYFRFKNGSIIYYIFCFLSFLGGFIKETLFIIPLLYLIQKSNYFSFISGKPAREFKHIINKITPIVLFLFSFTFSHLLVSKSENYSYFLFALSWIFKKNFADFIYAFIITFGPITAVAFRNPEIIVKTLTENKTYLFYSIILFILAYIGGSANERLLVPVLPIIGLIICNIFNKINNNRSDLFVYITLIILQIIASRIIWSIPDYPSIGQTNNSFIFFGLLGDKVDFLKQLSKFTSYEIKAIVIFQYGILIVLINLQYLYRNFKKYAILTINNLLN